MNVYSDSLQRTILQITASQHHARLLVVPEDNAAIILKNIAAQRLCTAISSYNKISDAICTCPSCRLIRQDQHPDLLWIAPEKSANTVKIEAVRHMIERVMISPKMSRNRVVVIASLDKLQPAASHALLKILEEPPECVSFVLAAQNINIILPTIVSRCQIWHIRDPLHTGADEALLKILEQDVDILLCNQHQVCMIAERWKAYDERLLLTVLYQMIAGKIRHATFYAPQNLPVFFMALDYLYTVLQKITHNVSINVQLVIENFLIILIKDLLHG